MNTGESDAQKLADLTLGLPIKLDLIDVNDSTGRFRPPSRAELEALAAEAMQGAGDLLGKHRLAGARLALDEQWALQRDGSVYGKLQVVVGDDDASESLRRKLALSPTVGATIVGRTSIDARQATVAGQGTRRRGGGSAGGTGAREAGPGSASATGAESKRVGPARWT